VRNLLALIGIFLSVWIWMHGFVPRVIDDAVNITKTGIKIVESIIQKEHSEAGKQTSNTPSKPSLPEDLPHLNKRISRQPRVVGSPYYQQVIQQALMRLYRFDREDYHLVGYYLSEIRESDHSGVIVFTGIFYNKLANFSGQNLIIWEAGDMVHDATHCYLYKNKYEFAGEEAEKYCCRVQKRCLERLGAPSFMVDYIEKAASSDYWDIPFDQRSW